MLKSNNVMDKLLNTTTLLLKKAAIDEKTKKFILNNELLYKLLKKAAERYIGGETLEQTIEKGISYNDLGHKIGIEFMGENTFTAFESTQASKEFIKAAECIASMKLNASLSLDLSHIGLSVSNELCRNNLQAICETAAKSNIEVTISAEDTNKTDAVLNTYLEASKSFSNLSITLQAYLRRTKDDLSAVIKTAGRVRLVKGAFDTPPGLSLPRGQELNRQYLQFLDALLSYRHQCSIATHDPYIQSEAKALITRHKTSKDLYEFESLYGIQIERLSKLTDDGHPTKVYFVYGTEWFLYLCNRLAEYPLNVLTALNDILAQLGITN